MKFKKMIQEIVPLGKRERVRRRCLRRGGELHDRADGTFDCVYYETDTTAEDGNQIAARKDPRDWGRRRCVRNGGSYTEHYSESGDMLEGSCAVRVEPATPADLDEGEQAA